MILLKNGTLRRAERGRGRDTSVLVGTRAKIKYRSEDLTQHVGGDVIGVIPQYLGDTVSLLFTQVFEIFPLLQVLQRNRTWTFSFEFLLLAILMALAGS